MLYARIAESRLFEITIPHAARESAHVVVSPEHPQQSIRRFIILPYIPILCLSLDRGWGPQSVELKVFVSASAGAREDRRVGGSRWADASYIQSDAESIIMGSITCLSPCYLGSRVSGRADCYMRASRNLGYLRLQFRTPLASPLTSLFLQNTPNNQFVASLYYLIYLFSV